MENEFIQMIERAKKGDKEVLIQLIMRQKQDYYRLAYIYMKNPDEALDAMEDMILKVYENIKRLKDNAAFYSWSKTILVNCCKNNLRRKNRVILSGSIPEGAYADVFQMKDEQLDIEQHLGKINYKFREILKLRYYLDLEYEAIAAILKIPLGTVKSRIHTGLIKLKESMGVSEE
ncbi:ECF subfamily RNA polymerase sigma-24 factor [Desulfosporosinus sp. HMP52]|uniref:RNA polymerase sigma factor n=1 Tax=Desulfosporosinus sp. HMP52 TaxID=1487923 RepID=UPI00051FA666|nr:RNA polymerase sigma factor [Desulfosporosinus sp. HMP52]KGK91835.1 ECF subfamily RNA polymerase sigma-24 factor [Desulfosporosinus sp. HMP52]